MRHFARWAAAAVAAATLAAATAEAADKGGKGTRPGTAARAKAPKRPAPPAPPAAPFEPIRWPAEPGDADVRRMAAAAAELANTRAAMADMLARRQAADAAREAGVDLVLDLTGALTSCANFQMRPPPITAPQWRSIEGQSLDRIGGMRQEYAPASEDARFTFARRAGRWHGPKIGMLSSKFRELFHPAGCDAAGLEADEKGVGGTFALTWAHGDFRYDMHFSGEGCGTHTPEFRSVCYRGGQYWPDWWVGPRERMQPSRQRFTLRAGRRRGWLLAARFLEPNAMPVGESALKGEVHAWIEDGQVRRGYVCNLTIHHGWDNTPHPIASVASWRAQAGRLEAELRIEAGKSAATYRLSAALSCPDAGRLAGTVAAATAKGQARWTAEGTLYRAFAGTYDSDGQDGRWRRDLVAGVAPAAEDAAKLPDRAIAPDAAPKDLFAAALDLYRDIAALDWALREYPMSLAEALRGIREGTDDRYTYWPITLEWHWRATRRRLLPAATDDMHKALAASLGPAAGGPATYLEGLARIARAALADRKAGTSPVAGAAQLADPDFGPFAGWGAAERAPSGGNVLAEPGDKDVPPWRIVGDWSCFGFIPRCYSFDTIPYLPEIGMDAVPIEAGGKLKLGSAARIAHGDAGVHLWQWRADPGAADGLVTIPLQCLLSREQRGRWGGAKATGVGGETLDFYYHNLATWYATTTVHADKPGRAWLAVKINWDGRLWVNGTLVWRAGRGHSPNRVAVIPVDLKAGVNRLTVCCSPRPTEDGNSGNFGSLVFKYGQRAFGSFAVWLCRGPEPRSAEAVAAARKEEDAADRARAGAIAARGMRGRRGDGSGCYGDANPPLAWDIDNGINVRWKAALPTDDAEPVIVARRLFVTTRDGELACLDADSGKLLWRRKPDVAGAGPVEETPYPPDAATSSFARSSRMWAGGEPAGSRENARPPSALARSCLTPLADARRVRMHDPRGRVACFDHDGRQVWARAVEAQVPRIVEGGYVTSRVVPPTHPAVVGPRLVAAVGAGLAAYDLDRGTELWRRQTLDYNGHFAVMDFGDGPAQQLVLLSSGEVLDAATGRTLVARAVPLMPDSTCQPVVAGRIAYFNTCSSAARFWTDRRGRLCCRLLWDSPTDIRQRQIDQNHGHRNGADEPDFFGQSTGAFPPTPVLHNGLLYVHRAELNSIGHGPQNSMRLQTYDAATGCAVAQRYGLLLNAMRPGSSTVVAGAYAFLASEGAVIEGDYPGFPHGVPMIAVTTAEDQPRRIAASRGLATLAPPVFAGRRIYLAGADQVVCIERPEALGDRFSDYEVAALKDGLFAHEIGRRPDAGDDIAVPPPTGLKVGGGVPAVPLVSGRTPNRWLFAGPFEVDEKADVFADRGGAAKVHPEAGQKVAYTAADGKRAARTFVVLSADGDKGRTGGADRPIIDAAYAGALGNRRLVGGVNFAAAAGRKYNTTCYLYSVLDVAEAGRYRVETVVGRIRNTDLYLAGTRVEHGTVVDLGRGRYPLMVRAAIATCGNWEPIEWAIQFRRLPSGAPPPPRPLDEPLPAGLRAPVAPLLLGGGLPPALLGAWPLPAHGRDDPPKALAALPGGVPAAGMSIDLDGRKVELRPVPTEALTPARTGLDRLLFNTAQPIAAYRLEPKALFADGLPSRGLFFALVELRRPVTVEFSRPEDCRFWLSGREIRDCEVIRLQAGLYTLLLECTATADNVGQSILPALSEVADPAMAQQCWLARVRRNEPLLRAIAASGPRGRYAREALDALTPDKAEGPLPTKGR